MVHSGTSAPERTKSPSDTPTGSSSGFLTDCQFDGPEPLWLQVANFIAREIAVGGMPPGTKLPAERGLCTRLKISRVTLRKALTHLVEEGQLTATHGRGWFVVDHRTASSSSEAAPSELESFSTTARRKHLIPASLVLSRATGPADHIEAERLDIPAGSTLFRMRRVRLLNGIRVAVDVTTMPLDVAPSLTEVDFATQSLFDELRRRGVELRRAEATIEACWAEADVADQLAIARRAPILLVDQVIYDDERPVLWSTIRYAGERYRLHTLLGNEGS